MLQVKFKILYNNAIIIFICPSVVPQTVKIEVVKSLNVLGLLIIQHTLSIILLISHLPSYRCHRLDKRIY
jgi:hypothetical protein